MENYSAQELGEFTFKVLPMEVDFRSKITMPSLTNYCLTCAGYHADICGYGLNIMEPSKRTWVVSRLSIEMMKYPKIGQKITVQTWVENILRLFAKRNFAFLDEDGAVLGYAKTIWTVIDTVKRKPTDLSFLLSQKTLALPCPVAPIKSIPQIADSNTPAETFNIKYSEIDFNQHFNSCKYVEHIMDSFTLHKFEKRDIKRFEIEYHKECLFNDQITLHKQKLPGNCFVIELRNAQQQSICRSRVTFGEKDLHEDYHPGQKQSI